MFKRLRRMIKDKIETPKDVQKWANRLEFARAQYEDALRDMKTFESYYEGTRRLQADANRGITPTKQATNVRNIVYELVESQVDSSIPMPRVRAIHPEDDELAKKMEKFLENKIRTCGITVMNDAEERTVPILGGDYTKVEWDVKRGLHSEVGDLKVSELYPTKVIPQPGVIDFDEMDYFFIQELMTKKTVKRVYGQDVSDCENSEEYMTDDIKGAKVNEDLVTVNTAFYRNDRGGVGIFVWCDFIKLLDLDEYEARYIDRCAKCGTVMVDGKCPSCGSKKATKAKEEYEELLEGVEIKVSQTETRKIDPEMITEQPMLDENGNPVLDDFGQPRMSIERVKRKVPYYRPNIYPVILRKNITAQKQLLGGSDVKVIIDQQDTIKKLGTKINEKLLKGGSYVTLPEGVEIEKDGEELNILRLRSPADKQMIDTITLQPNVANDQQYLEINYSWAKSSLGITDSYQGKYDAYARTGTAKQYAINQAAGRLESKRTLKNEAYAKLYEVMFKFWLAFSDSPSEISSVDKDGQPTHDQLDRKEFLRIDAAGEFYWNDEFIFETDPTSTLMQNREAMWSQTDLKLQSGAFGPVGDLETSKTYWTMMKANGYPNASVVLAIIEERLQEQKDIQAQMAQMQQPEVGLPEGGAGNELSVL
jgi:predicted  nucleic acid-binding Zn-ribbon protein